MTIRKAPRPPLDAAPKGHCRMCGDPILTKDGSRTAQNRRWCDSHQIEARIRQHPVYARAAVFRRDRGICRDCGTDCTAYDTQSPPAYSGIGITLHAKIGDPYRVQINRERALDWCERLLTKTQNPRNRQSMECIDLGQWEADHVYPLWLVDREEPGAWKYWTLENLVTRCPSCHQEKTSKEAGQRAKVKRLNGTTPKRRKGQKIPQRANPWPPRGSRKIQNRRAQ